MKPSIVKNSLLLVALLFVASPLVAGAANKTQNCALTMDLSLEEQGAITMFRARLSHLLDYYGTPQFDAKLDQIVSNSWPKAKVIQISPTFFEQAANQVDQARLIHAVARTAGLDNPDWQRFSSFLMKVTIRGDFVSTKYDGYEQTTQSLLKAIKAATPRDPKISGEEFAMQKAEAIARVVDMYTYIIRWSAVNRGLLDEHAAASAKQMGIIAIGLVGGGIMLASMTISGPFVAGAGAYAATFSANPATAILLAKLGEVAAGATLGIIGAPTAHAITDSYQTVSEASKQSRNLQTSYSCELSKQIQNWKDQGAGPYLNAALMGGGLGIAGGALTFTRASAQMILYTTGFGVGVAQTFSLYKTGSLGLESLAYYKLAEEAEDRGEHAKAVELLKHSRDLAQEAGEKGLESIIIGTLSHYMLENFRHAMTLGEGAIRTLYANSTDTLPLAGKVAVGLMPHSNVLPLSDSKER